MNPLASIAKQHLGELVHVFAQGGHRFTGRITHLSDNGDRLRLVNQPPEFNADPIVFHIDLDSVVAISLKGAQL